MTLNLWLVRSHRSLSIIQIVAMARQLKGGPYRGRPRVALKGRLPSRTEVSQTLRNIARLSEKIL